MCHCRFCGLEITEANPLSAPDGDSRGCAACADLLKERLRALRGRPRKLGKGVHFSIHHFDQNLNIP